MFALFLQCSKIKVSAAKLSHPLKDEGYFFFRRDMQPNLIDKKTPFPDNGHLHPCSMVVIASKNLTLILNSRTGRCLFFIPLNMFKTKVSPHPMTQQLSVGEASALLAEAIGQSVRHRVRTMWKKLAKALDGESRMVWQALGVQLSRRDLLDITLGSVLGASGVIASNVLPSWLGLVGGLSLLAAGVRIAWQPSSRLMKNISLTDN